MTLPRARILRAEGAGRLEPLLAVQPSAPQRRRIAREEIEARLEAERILREARERADSLLADAEKEALATVDRVSRQAQEDAQAQLVARWIALRDAEGLTLTRDVDRVVAVAVVLAERLIGAALELTPVRDCRPRSFGARRSAWGAPRANRVASGRRRSLAAPSVRPAARGQHRRRSRQQHSCARRASASHRPGNHRCQACTPTRATCPSLARRPPVKVE